MKLSAGAVWRELAVTINITSRDATAVARPASSSNVSYGSSLLVIMHVPVMVMEVYEIRVVVQTLRDSWIRKLGPPEVLAKHVSISFVWDVCCQSLLCWPRYPGFYKHEKYIWRTVASASRISGHCATTLLASRQALSLCGYAGFSITYVCTTVLQSTKAKAWDLQWHLPKQQWEWCWWRSEQEQFRADKSVSSTNGQSFFDTQFKSWLRDIASNSSNN